ncbi:MAG: hypothetical protein P1P84_17885 [Deferrisomatales bacterium]|nr:hypothetical protein [Deferrisomatales bacterium]
MADADPSTTTDPTNPDSDGDGFLDGEEDLNGNGRVDLGEMDPNAGICFGDLDGDKDVDSSDLDRLSWEFGTHSCAGNCLADLDDDGDVDQDDLGIFSLDLGRVLCP